MAYGEFYVEQQGWARWPKVLIMCRKRGRDESGNIIAERRRYVPEDKDDYQRKQELNRRNQANNDLVKQNMLLSEQVEKRDVLIRDLWSGQECGAGCSMYEACLHPNDDRCLMEERILELGIEV